MDEIDDMKPEYDFSKGERGKFYRPDAKLMSPLYVEHDLAMRLLTFAEAEGSSVTDMITAVLERELKLRERQQAAR